MKEIPLTLKVSFEWWRLWSRALEVGVGLHVSHGNSSLSKGLPELWRDLHGASVGLMEVESGLLHGSTFLVGYASVFGVEQKSLLNQSEKRDEDDDEVEQH